VATTVLERSSNGTTSLTNHPNYPALFRRHVLANAQYWQEYVTNRSTDIAALDNERDCILKAISFALEIEIAWPCVYQVIVIFSSFMERRGHWESWNRLLNQALKTAQRLEDVTRATTLSALLARLLQQQSRIEPAILQHRHTIRLARQTGNRFEEARACTNLGFLYIEQGQWYRAEVLCCHALNIFEAINSDHGRAHTENHLGILYTRQCLWDKGEQYLKRACATWQAMGDNHGLMRGFINLSFLYIEMEKGSKALKYLKKALHQAKLTGEKTELGTIYLNMGAAYRLSGEPTQAEAQGQRAETIFRQSSNLVGLALAWINLGMIYTAQQEWKKAKKYLETGLQACRDLKNEYGEISTLLGMVEYELARGDQQQALVRLKELEYLIKQEDKNAQYNHLQQRLAKYRAEPGRFSRGALRVS
jgi:tetratricopeptide (TPR) repeat protein